MYVEVRSLPPRHCMRRNTAGVLRTALWHMGIIIFASLSGNKKESCRSSQVSIIRYINYLPLRRSFVWELHLCRFAYHIPLLPISYDNLWSRSMGHSFQLLSQNRALDLYKCGRTNSAVWCRGMLDNDKIREPPHHFLFLTIICGHGQWILYFSLSPKIFNWIYTNVVGLILVYDVVAWWTMTWSENRLSGALRTTYSNSLHVVLLLLQIDVVAKDDWSFRIPDKPGYIYISTQFISSWIRK